MGDLLIPPPGTLTTLELELDGNDQLGNPRNWADAAQRVNVKRVGHAGTLIAACLYADGGVATNFGATPAQQVQVNLNRLAVIGNVFDPDPANDELLIADLTIEPGENFGPVIPAPRLITFNPLSALSADSVIAGGTYTPPVDLGHKYVGWGRQNRNTYTGVQQLYLGDPVTNAPINLGVVDIAMSAPGLIVFKAAALAAGYTFPNEPAYGLPPLLDAGQLTLPQNFADYLSNHAGIFWWEVPSFGTHDPATDGVSSNNINTAYYTDRSATGRSHPIVPEIIGPTASGVKVLAFIG